jgi:RNA polymerase sigma-70 factor (ECF subfamily)
MGIRNAAARRRDELTELPALTEAQVAALHANHSARLTRVLSRLCGDPDVADDVVQEAFIKLHQRGSIPDAPGAWLVSVALNLLRNVARGSARHLRLLTTERAEALHGSPPRDAHDLVVATENRGRVRRALDALPKRDQQLLLLRAEGYSYRELSEALQLNEQSIGTLLARAKSAFRTRYTEDSHAS